jgi:hypothetical protein
VGEKRECDGVENMVEAHYMYASNTTKLIKIRTGRRGIRKNNRRGE